jgi:hypothetical protein
MGRRDRRSGARGRAAAAAALLAAVLAAAAPARGETVPFADDGALPWASGAAVSPLERYGSSVLEELVGKPVEVRCEGENDWSQLARQYGFDPAFELGYVVFWQDVRGDVAVGKPYPDTFAELSPFVCRYLQRYAAAESKPTRCEPLTRTTETVYERVEVPVQIRERVIVRVPVRVKARGAARPRVVVRPVARTVTRTVTRPRDVAKTVERESRAPSRACYEGSTSVAGTDDEYWAEYRSFALALLTLAHEARHLAGVFEEWDAQCGGVQLVRRTAERFGASAEDASAVARYAWEQLYPQYRGTDYWSEDCRPDGALDHSPGDGVWP